MPFDFIENFEIQYNYGCGIHFFNQKENTNIYIYIFFFFKKNPAIPKSKSRKFPYLFFFSLCFSFLGTPQTSWANGLCVELAYFYAQNDWGLKKKGLSQVNELCQCHLKWHNLCYNLPMWHVVNGRKMSTHGSTIIPLPFTTRHMGKLWYKHNSRLVASCNYIYT